jgi:hypothetical protein
MRCCVEGRAALAPGEQGDSWPMDSTLTMASKVSVFQSIKEVHWSHPGTASWLPIAVPTQGMKNWWCLWSMVVEKRLTLTPWADVPLAGGTEALSLILREEGAPTIDALYPRSVVASSTYHRSTLSSSWSCSSASPP